MKSVSPALAAHLTGEATTLATLWRVVRRDGAVFTFTDHDRDIVYGGETYACALGYAAAAATAAPALQALAGVPVWIGVALVLAVAAVAVALLLRRERAA
jgi:hypothetical protein